jgi:hypothetical protein
MTSTVERYLPMGPRTDVHELLAELPRPADARLVVGDERVRAFLVDVGRALLRPDAVRRYPQLAALGFFLRPATLSQTLERVPVRGGERRFPRGMVFHITPSNVDTIFAYSWALSMLAGNTNVVRVSARVGPAARTLLDVLNAALARADPVVARTQRMIGYDRDRAVTAALSRACDLRVIWGGDQAIREVRAGELSPASRDLTFSDRSSFSVISASGWLVADRATRDATARGFYNDAYWFDQAACASPRAIFWVGDPDTTEPARSDFHASLLRVLHEVDAPIDAAMAIEKRVATYGLAAEGAVTSIRFAGNALATAQLAAAELMPRRWLGAGTFAEARVDRLVDLVPVVDRRDQTVTYFGFDRATLTEFADALAGRGVDRLVPVGSALDFASTWDGYDLLYEFTRLTTVLV